MKYRDLKPDELVAEDDEFEDEDGEWCESQNWTLEGRKQDGCFRYRRPIKKTIQDRLQSLAVDMREVAFAMREENQSATMQSKGLEVLGAASLVSEWLESMKAEETIQGFVEGRKQ